jgi:hypothetical protein
LRPIADDTDIDVEQQRPLVIVESRAKAGPSPFLGRDRYVVKASVGHIRDLPRSEPGAEECHQAESAGRAGRHCRRQTSGLKAALKLERAVPRHGRTARRGVSCSLSAQASVPVKRMVFHEITNEAIARAIDNWRPRHELVEAQEECVLDRLVGYGVERAFHRIGRECRPDGCRALRRDWSSTEARGWPGRHLLGSRGHVLGPTPHPASRMLMASGASGRDSIGTGALVAVPTCVARPGNSRGAGGASRTNRSVCVRGCRKSDDQRVHHIETLQQEASRPSAQHAR